MNRQFGALSGLAILLIILNHSIYMGITIPPELGYPSISQFLNRVLSFFQAFGVFAVPIFLFISGSFVAYAARGEPPVLPKKFIWNSLKHILVPYFIWSILSYIVMYVHYQESYSLLGYIKNLLVGYPYHFIPLLVGYYLISPMLVRFGKTSGAIILGVIGLYQIFLISVVYPGIFGFDMPSFTRYLTPPVLRTTLADWAIFFPMGLIYGLNAKTLQIHLYKMRWLFWSLTAMIFLAGVLDANQVLVAPWAKFLCPVPAIMLLPVIRRETIPYAKPLEKLGRKTYGIYLMHLIIIDLTLMALEVFIPIIFELPILLFPILFLAGLYIPFLCMEISAKGPTRQVYRYIFG